MSFSIKFFLYIAVLLIGLPALAGRPSLITTVASLSAEASSIARETDQAARQRKALNLLQKYFDFETFAKWTLHDHWDGLSDGQRQRFLDAFSDRFMTNALDSLSKRSERSVKFRVIRQAERKEFTEVFCEILHNGSGDDLTLTWVHRNNRWGLVDVSVAGAYLAANYQGQFNKLIRKYGFEGLMERLR